MAKADPVSTRPLLDKLGVKPDSRVCVLNIVDESFRTLLRLRTSDVSERLRASCNLIFFAADSLKDLERLPRLRTKIVQNGAVWVVSRKGKAAALRDVDVIAAAKRSGLVDNKVVSFSGTHTALRLVIPLALRS